MIRKKYINFISYLSVSCTWWVTICILLLTLFLGYRASILQVQTSFHNLYSNDDICVDEYKRIIDEFQNESYILLLAKGANDSLKSYAEAVKPLLEDFDEWVASVHTHINEDFYRENAIKLLSSNKLKNFSSMFYDPNLVPFIHNLNDSIEREYQRNDDPLNSRRDILDVVHFLDGLEIFIDLQRQVMDGASSDNLGEYAVDAITFGETYMFSPDKDMILIMIEPTFNIHIESNELKKRIDTIEKVIKDLSKQYGITAGLTGALVLGRDEYDALTSSAWAISIFILFGVFILFILFFRTWESSLFVILNVILGLTWAIGVSSYLVDNFNIMTIVMSCILIGLSVDSSVHIISSYTENRNHGLNVHISIRETLKQFVPGILTGGITTGIVFLTFIFSDIEFIQKMGLMLGIGIIISMFSTTIILPTILVVRERFMKTISRLLPAKDGSYSFPVYTAEYIAQYRWIIIIIFVFVTVLLLKRSYQMTVDYNYLNMMPIGLESNKLQNELINTFDFSSDLVMVTSKNLNEIREITTKVREMKTIGLVESISDYLPDPEGLEKQFHIIQDIRRNLKVRETRKQMSSHDMKMYQKEITRLEANIIELQDLAYQIGQNEVYNKAVKLVGEAGDSFPRGILTQYINDIETELSQVELTYFQQKFSTRFKSTIMKMANTRPLTLANLPSGIKNRFIGKNEDLFIINIYPRNNIWEDTLFLNHFLSETTELNAKVTGGLPIFVKQVDIIKHDGEKLIYIAIITIFLVLLIDFRSIKYVLVGMVPLVFGVIWMIGVMEISELQFNMVNILVIPLIIGLGVNNGAHILNHWKIENDLGSVYRTTGKAILLTTLIIMFSFGTLCFTTFLGLRSLGISIVIGVGGCFLSTFFLLMPLLGSFQKKT